MVVLGGRDASQNEELVKKYMTGGDLFVHADVHGASVVIVKGTTEKMDEVAQFAASYTGAWRSGHFSADVYSAQPNQVSKTPESGDFVTGVHSLSGVSVPITAMSPLRWASALCWNRRQR